MLAIKLESNYWTSDSVNEKLRKLMLESWFKCDVGNAEDVERTFSEISSKFPNRNISILINNAGHTKLLPLLDHEKINNQSCLKPESLKEAADIYKSLMDTNILGPTLVTRAAMKFFDHTKVYFSGKI